MFKVNEKDTRATATYLMSLFLTLIAFTKNMQNINLKLLFRTLSK